jgi:hypothetical protein
MGELSPLTLSVSTDRYVVIPGQEILTIKKKFDKASV